jgi:hypothetical protein
MRGGYAPEKSHFRFFSLRFEIPEARKSEMNKDHRIWRTYDDHWIRVVGQQTTSARTRGRPCLQGHVAETMSDMWQTCGRPRHKDMWQTTSARQTKARTCGRPRQQTTCGRQKTCGRPCQQTTSANTHGIIR